MILVTGAAGFIGSNLVASYNDAGRSDLVLCDWLGTDGRWENLAKRSFQDFLLPEQVDHRLASKDEAITLVLHMGAISETTASDGDLVMQRNYQFTRHLWTWCAERGVTFVYASSAATYGDGALGFDDRIGLSQLRCLRPLNLYGWSKHVFDLYACDAPKVEPAHWYGLKFFNVFGPNEYHKGSMQSLLCKSADKILVGQPSKLFRSHHPDFKDGEQTRDFIYVDAVCDVIKHFGTGQASSGLYNVGTGVPRSFHDLISAGYSAVGREPSIEYVDTPVALRDRYQYFTKAETQKLRASGYNQPFAPLESSVDRYVTDYLMNRDRYR